MERRTAYGQVIRELRSHKSLTQPELAAKLEHVPGLKQADISKIERGSHKSGEMHVGVLAEALGVTSGEIMERLEHLLDGKPRRLVHSLSSISASETPSEYVRVEHLDGEAGMGEARINDDYPEVIKAMDFTPTYIRSIVGFMPKPGRLVLITGRGDSMMPTIQPGESLIVDTGVNAYDNDGIYLVNLGNGQQIKRLVDHGKSAGLYVHSDNKAYPELPLPKDAVIGGKVYLRNRIDRFN